MGEVERFAKGLSQGARGALLATGDDGKIPVYSGRKSNGQRLRISLPTLRKLERQGLATSYPAYLTPLGVAVRGALRNPDA